MPTQYDHDKEYSVVLAVFETPDEHHTYIKDRATLVNKANYDEASFVVEALAPAIQEYAEMIAASAFDSDSEVSMLSAAMECSILTSAEAAVRALIDRMEEGIQ